jgi:signal transduction histidine kinase
MQPKRKPLQVGPFLEAIARFQEGEASNRGVGLVVQVEPDLPVVFADEGLLRTALLNLVLNAIQAQPGGGEVRLEARREGEMMILEISDSGEGIPEDKAEEIFQIFVTTKPGGTGLGLPIARRIAECHGGSLRVIASGEREGKGGACMKMEIPLGNEE